MVTKNRKLVRLYKKHKGKCYYCNCLTFLQESGSDGYQTDKSATIEHIYSRVDIRRFLKSKLVLSCFKCNNGKNEVDGDEIFNNGVYQNSMYSDSDGWRWYDGILIKLLHNPDNIINYLKMITEIRNPFTTEFYLSSWKLWKDFKKEQFKFEYKSIGEQAILTDLYYLSDKNEETAHKIIMQSIANGWKGFYELKDKKNEHGKPLDADKLKNAILRKVG